MTERVRLDSILAHPVILRDLGGGLVTALPQGLLAAPYDRRAAAYDAVVGRSIYHRICWGTSVQSHSRFARAALHAAGEGYFAEAGCGSLLFTSSIYRDYRGPFALLADRSIEMLRRGITRLSADRGRIPDGVSVLHADAAALPVRSGIFSSILSLNLLHVPCDAAAITEEFSRVLIPGRGRLFVSALVRCGRWSDAYMALLHRLGELAAPATPDELHSRVAGEWGVVESTMLEGNMCFMVVRHAG